MSNDRQDFKPLLERHGVRETILSKPWVTVPELESGVLGEWCYDVLRSNFKLFYSEQWGTDVLFIQTEGVVLARSLNIDLPPVCQFDYDEHFFRSVVPDPMDTIMATTRNDDDMLLNIADYLLASQLVRDDAAAGLRRLLSGSNSAWQVNEAGSGLALRVSVEEELSFLQSSEAHYPYSHHLQLSWEAAWRRNNPSASEAYDSAVKAIESILAPIVTPADPSPSLGKLIAALRDKPDKWNTRFRGAETVSALSAMLGELWKTNSRHAGTQPNNLEQAQDAVTIAVAVVGLVRRGFLERADTSSFRTADPPTPPRADPPQPPTATGATPDARSLR